MANVVFLAIIGIVVVFFAGVCVQEDESFPWLPLIYGIACIFFAFVIAIGITEKTSVEKCINIELNNPASIYENEKIERYILCE